MLKKDQSFTSLGRKRLKKSAKILAVLGDLDELVVSLGLTRAFSRKKRLKEQIRSLQADLVKIGGFLAGVEGKPFPWGEKRDYFKKRIGILKNHRLKKFSLPGKDKTAVFLHQSRTVTRRLERKVIALKRKKDQPLVDYLNCLSLFLFWLAVKEEGE